MFEIGAMSIALTRLIDDDEPTCEQILRKAAETGVDGVEFYESDWGGGAGDLDRADSVRAAADSLGVELFALGSAARIGYHDERREQALQTLRRQVDVAAAVGAGTVTCAAIDSQPVPAGRDAAQGGLPFARAVAPLAQQLRELAEYAHERQVRVALLNHCWFVSTSWHQNWALRLAGTAGACPAGAGACLDPGNYLYYEGEDPLAATRRLAPVVAVVRLGDMRRRDEAAVAGDFEERRQLQTCEPVVFGEGHVDHAGCLSVLRDAGYGGWLSIKSVGSSPAGPHDAFERSLGAIRQLVAGLS